jgi:hypothetical protein
MPSTEARWCGPRLRVARFFSTFWTLPAGKAWGQRWGREDRSARPASPSERYRRTHLWAVARDTPAALAVSATLQPSSSTRWAMSNLPNGVSLALRWAMRASFPARDLVSPTP